MPKTRFELMTDLTIPEVQEIRMKYSNSTPESTKVLEEKWYSEAEYKAELKKVFGLIEKLDISLKFKQKMMAISQGDILLIPQKELDRLQSELLGKKKMMQIKIG